MVKIVEALVLSVLYLIATLTIGLLLSIDTDDGDYVLSVTAWAWLAGMVAFVLAWMLA